MTLAQKRAARTVTGQADPGACTKWKKFYRPSRPDNSQGHLVARRITGYAGWFATIKRI